LDHDADPTLKNKQDGTVFKIDVNKKYKSLVYIIILKYLIEQKTKKKKYFRFMIPKESTTWQNICRNLNKYTGLYEAVFKKNKY